MNNFPVPLIVLLLLTGTVQLAEAKERDFVSIDKFANTDLGTWSAGDGDRVWSDTNCVASSNYSDAFNDPPPLESPPAVHVAYQFQLEDRNNPAGYYFYLDGDDANTGNARLQATFEHRDVKVGSGFETLSDAAYDAHAHTGQFKNCNNGDNSELQLTILNTDLQNARAGSYQGNFRAQVIGAGGKTDKQNLKMDIAVSEIVRVSALDNVSLGNWTSGDGDLAADEPFCIYSNNDAAAYNITISSAQQDGGGNFRLANVSLTEYVSYGLTFADTVGGVGNTVTTTPISGSGNNTASDCGGVDNAEVSVSVLAVDLGAATPDNYSDTITLLVAPE